MKNFEWENQINSTQRLSSLKRNQRSGFMIGSSHQQFINQLATIRILQDENMALKMKNQTLQRKAFEYIETIAQLQYAMSDLKLMLQRADNQIIKNDEMQKQIEDYEQNIKQVGQQLKSLNEIVEKKNKQCIKLVQANQRLKQQNAQMEKKYKQYQSMREQQKSKVRELLELLHSENDPSFSEEMLGDILIVQQGINELKQKLAKTKDALEKSRKQCSQLLIKEKQRVIQLEYQLKLSQKRNQDLQKKKNLESTFQIDKKIQNIIDQMLKKQDELTSKIGELEDQNESLRQQIQSERLSSSRFSQLKKTDVQRQIRQAKETIRQLISQKDSIRQKFQQLSSIRQMESSRAVNEQLETSRKYRQFCQQNKRLKLKISELQSDKKMLQKQLTIRNIQ